MTLYTKDFIIDYLQYYYKKTNTIPKCTAKHYPFSTKTAINKFGSWGDALDSAGIPRRVNSPQIATKHSASYGIR